MFESVLKIVTADTKNLIELARQSGYDSREFFVGADLANTDLRGLDFSKYYFHNVNVSGALTDRSTILPSDVDLSNTRFDLTPDILDSLRDRLTPQLNPEQWVEGLLYLFVCFGAVDRADFYVWGESEYINMIEKNAAETVSFASNYNEIMHEILPFVGTSNGASLLWYDKKKNSDRETSLSERSVEEIETLAIDVLVNALASSPHADLRSALHTLRSSVKSQELQVAIRDLRLIDLNARPERPKNKNKKPVSNDGNIGYKSLLNEMIWSDVPNRLSVYLSILDNTSKNEWQNKYKLPKKHYIDFSLLGSFLNTQAGTNLLSSKRFGFLPYSNGKK